MLSRCGSIVAIALSAGLAAMEPACGREVKRSEQVVLEVGGRSVSLSEFDRFVRTSVQQESPVLSSEVMSALFEQFIEEQLLLRAADDAGIHADADLVAKRLASLQRMGAGSPEKRTGNEIGAGAPVLAKPSPEAPNVTATLNGASGDEPVADDTADSVERQLRIEKLVASRVLSGIRVTDEEIASYYEAHRDDFVRPETVDVSQILVDDEALANELRKTILAKKATFEDLARERSQAPDASNGGHLGAFSRGELPPSFEAQVFTLKPGVLSEVVPTDFGFHIFRVNSKSESRALAIDDVRETIRVDLLREKSDQAMKGFVAELQKRYPVKVYHEHLTFAVSEPGSAAGSSGGSAGQAARMEKGR